MSQNLELAHDYLASKTPWLWNWQDGGSVLTWTNGSAIAFAAEIGIVLSRLEAIGLPRFGSVAILLGAARNSWTGETSGRDALEVFLKKFHGRSESEFLFADVLEGLDRVHELRDLLVSPTAKAELAAAVFESAKYRLYETPTKVILHGLQTGLPAAAFAADSKSPADSILADVVDLRKGLAKVTRESLLLRLATGLEEPVEAAPMELPPCTTARELIRQLADDEELGGVARLARLLLATVHIPRPLFDPESLPVGGITDITNRGPLDRLMLSELAHDDLTLAVRIAMNEALYLRREPFPRAQPRQRFVLLDSGLRMWGVPRVFATAVGLAVAAQADDHVEVVQWRASNNGLVPVDFTTREGLVNHLAALDHHVHPGGSLPDFAEAISSGTMPSDALLITCDEVLRDQEFRQALRESKLESLHIAELQRDGAFRLIHRSSRGTRMLRQATFALDQVLAPEHKPTTSLVNSQVLPAMPAIYSVEPFPLRISASVTAANSWHNKRTGYVLTLTKDGRLLRWDSRLMGAREISHGLPSGQIHWCAIQDSELSLVLGKISQRGLYSVRLNLESGRQSIRQLRLHSDQPRVITLNHGALLIIFAKHVEAFDPMTGSLLDSRDNPYGSAKWSRFVPLEPGHYGSVGWFAITFDGARIQFTMLDRHVKPARQLLGVFDSLGHPSGPVGVTTTADLVFPGNESPSPVTFETNRIHHEILAVSRDGCRIVLGGRSKPSNQILIDLETLSGKGVYGDPKRLAECLSDVAKPRAMRRFRGIFVDRFGRLTLSSRKGSLFPICVSPPRNCIYFPKEPLKKSVENKVIRFEPVDTSCVGGRDLSVARWPDGSMAILDSLGMLHLRSSDSTIPECTIVLSDGRLSGWVADGRFWGESYFIAQNKAASEGAIWEEILQPFTARLV